MTGLLLLAFTFFVFAQAAVVRSGAQSAADAAALAAAQEARDQMFENLLGAADEEDAEDALEGIDETGSACEEAARLAARNDAEVTSCQAADVGREYTVDVVSTDTVGDSVIPGTEEQTARTQATAVIGALCDDAEEDGDRIELSCEDRDWTIDPDDEDSGDDVPEARDLFEVYLEDQ